MKSVKSKRLRAVGLFIILIALILSYYKNVYKSVPAQTSTQNMETERYFESSGNHDKVRLDINVKSFDDLRNLIYTKLDQQGAKKVITEEFELSANYVYLVESQQLSAFISDVSNIANIKSRKELNQKTPGIDLESKLRDTETMYQKEFSDYNNSKTKYSYQLSRIEKLRNDIDSLKMEISQQSSESTTMLYISAQMAQNRVGKFGNVGNFITGFLFYTVVFTLVVILLYYGTYLLMFLLAMIGVKLPSISSYLGKGYNDYAGYKGYKGYGSYGSGKKRHIKRIYRNKESSDSDTHEEEEK